MRLVSLAVILLAAAAWLAVGGRAPSVGEQEDVAEITRSSRRGVTVFDGAQSARRFLANLSDQAFARKSGYDRVRAAMREFGEDELLDMVDNDVPLNDQASLWRKAAIWERLGELGSERALNKLLESREVTVSPNLGVVMHPDFQAEAFVGGWASSMDSLKDIQEELFPHLKKLKDAGFRRHEFALGREMARFDPTAAWNILSAPMDSESALTGANQSLRGLVKGLAGDSGLTQLMGFIQLRQDPEPLLSWSPSNDLDIVDSFILDLPQAVGAYEPIQIDGIHYSGGSPSRLIDQTDATSTIVFVETEQTGHLLSEAVGTLMISNPEMAKDYFGGHEFKSFEVPSVHHDKVWKTMAKLDPGAAINLLQDPEFSGFAEGIARGVLDSAPERVDALLEYFPDPTAQQKLIAEVVNRFPRDRGYGYSLENMRDDRGVDREERLAAIERALDQSVLDQESIDRFRDRLQNGPESEGP